MVVAADLFWQSVWIQARDRKGKIVDLCCQDGYKDTSLGVPLMTRCFGPNGVQTETVQQMLELLRLEPPPEMPWLKPPEPAALPPAVEQPALPAPDLAEAGVEHAASQPGPEAASMEEAMEPEKSVTAEQCAKGEANLRNNNKNDIYEAEEPDDEQDDGSRPQPITAKDIARIDDMSPNELNALIEDVDAHEEWEELRREAKQRIEFWEGGLKIAHQSPRCGYIKNNGKPCGSPAMKDDSFCYFHSQASVQRDSVAAAGGLELPALDDRLGVQLAIMRVCGMLVDKSLDEKTGRAVLVGLRLAQKNLGHADALFGPNDLD